MSDKDIKEQEDVKQETSEVSNKLDELLENAPKEDASPEEQQKFIGDMMNTLFGALGECPDCQPKIKFIKNHENTKLPEYKSDKASGFDFYTPIDFTIKAGKSYVVNTGLRVADIPEGYEIQIRSRSGLAAKDSIFVLNTPGTIDNDYRGDIMIILFNLSDTDKEFHVGDRIAQGVVSVFNQATPIFVTEEELNQTERGDGGLGSTGA